MQSWKSPFSYFKLNMKPDIIEKIKLPKDQMDEINSILEGKPGPNIIKYWQRKGMDVSQKTKWYTPVQTKERMRRISQKYKISSCHYCHGFSAWKLIWKKDGINLVEFYCDSCYDRRVKHA